MCSEICTGLEISCNVLVSATVDNDGVSFIIITSSCGEDVGEGESSVTVGVIEECECDGT